MAELSAGEALFRSAGAFGSPGFAAKINEARPHLNKAMELIEQIPEPMRDGEVEAISTKCGRLLSACFKVPLDVH